MWQNISNALSARRKFRIAFHLQKEEYKLHPYVFTVRKSNWNDNQIGHLGVPKFLTFKTRLRVKPFLVKLKFYLHENRKEITVISIASQLARFETEAWGSLEIMLKKVKTKVPDKIFH